MRVVIVAVFAVLCVANTDATQASPTTQRPRLQRSAMTPLDDYTNLLPALKSFVTEAAKQHNMEWTLDEIFNAQSQVVAGTRYVGEASVNDAGEKKKCRFRITERPWDGFIGGVLSCHPDYKDYEAQIGPNTQA